MRASVWAFLESYGWFLVTGVGLSYLFYSYYVAPRLHEVQKAKELVNRKKFDEDVHQKVADKMAAARAKQQEHHNIVAADLKAREEEEKEKKFEELIKTIEKESVLKYAVNAPAAKTAAKKESPGEFIDRQIQSKPVVMFSKTTCPFCRKAKSVLATFRLAAEHYSYVELDEGDAAKGEQIQQEFIRRYGTRSVPKVFIGGELIGGGDDTVALFQQGVLQDIVQAAINAFSSK